MLDNTEQWSKLLKQFVGTERHQMTGMCLHDQSQPDDGFLNAIWNSFERLDMLFWILTWGSMYFEVFCCVIKVNSLTSVATYWGGSRWSVDRITFSSSLARTVRRILMTKAKDVRNGNIRLNIRQYYQKVYICYEI